MNSAAEGWVQAGMREPLLQTVTNHVERIHRVGDWGLRPGRRLVALAYSWSFASKIPITAADSPLLRLPACFFLLSGGYSEVRRPPARCATCDDWMQKTELASMSVILTTVGLHFAPYWPELSWSLHEGHNSEGLPVGWTPSFWAASRLILLAACRRIFRQHASPAELPCSVRHADLITHRRTPLHVHSPRYPADPSLLYRLSVHDRDGLGGTVRGILRRRGLCPRCLPIPSSAHEHRLGARCFPHCRYPREQPDNLDRRPKLSGAVLANHHQAASALGVPIAFLIISGRWTALACAAGAALGPDCSVLPHFRLRYLGRVFCERSQLASSPRGGAAGSPSCKAPLRSPGGSRFSVAPAYLCSGRRQRHLPSSC